MELPKNGKKVVPKYTCVAFKKIYIMVKQLQKSSSFQDFIVLFYLKWCNLWNDLAPEVTQNRMKCYNYKINESTVINVTENIISLIVNTVESTD